MAKFTYDEHVLPRPVERLPDYANARARQSLAERLTAAFKLSDASATAFANAVVDPSEVRKVIGDPNDPDVEKIAVPGGTLQGIRTRVWARRIMPDPRNPRTLPSRRYPFAVEPGSGGEESKFRPLPEPRPLDPQVPQLAELAVDIESRHHLTWAAQQGAAFVIAENDWRESIASQGVMEAVWLVATTYTHSDGTAPVTVPTTAEGSSRTTAVHALLTIRSADVAYDDNEAKLRAHIRKLNETVERGPTKIEAVSLRCETIPALILVGFVPHRGGSTAFSTAVKSFVALRHVDPPKPWGAGPENEALADEVLDELYRRDLISATERDYFGGACTRAEARAAHLPDDPTLRAAYIVRTLSSHDERVEDAIRVAVTSQSTRKHITTKLVSDLATALILRAVSDDPARVDQIRRYLRHAFGKAVFREKWKSTGRSTEQLVQDAVVEVRQAIGDDTIADIGPSSLELAVRAAFPLIVTGRLSADRGTANNLQPDRRTPGEVLDAMRRSIHGVFQLGQALVDYEDGVPFRAVAEDGEVRILPDGAEQTVNDIYLRNEFPPPGRAKVGVCGDTPLDHYDRCVGAFQTVLETLDEAYAALARVVGDDGRPLVESRGVDHRLGKAWRETLNHIDEDLLVWTRTFRRAFGTDNDRPSFHAEDDEPESVDEDNLFDQEDEQDEQVHEDETDQPDEETSAEPPTRESVDG